MKYGKLKQLGNEVEPPETPADAVLESVENPYPDDLYNIRFTCPEFTSLCPLTDQPDFARLVIDYIPNKKILESKSLKLFLNSFRNHGDFHEACTMYIAKRIIKEIKPHWFRIGGYWFPRGGIPIDVFYQTDIPPAEVWIPDQGVETYKGR